jgi:N-acetylglutamate synthase-like GNAT family acetyltransferase
MNPSVEFSLAEAPDWSYVTALLAESGLALEGLTQPVPGYTLAWENTRAVGVVGTERYGDVALIRSLAVTPSRRGLGIGRALLKRVLAHLSREGVQRAYVLTVTTPEYFALFGFRRGPHDQAPAGLRASAEFQRACAACTALMSLPLSNAATVPISELLQPVVQRVAGGCCPPTTAVQTNACCNSAEGTGTRSSGGVCCG